MKNCKSRGTRTPVYERNTPMPPVKPAKAEEKEKVFYLCDRRACEKCSPECRHTTDIRHAANFCVRTNGSMWETLHGSREEFVIGVDLAEGKDFTVYGNGMQAPESEG